MAMYYFSKLVKAKALGDNSAASMTKFLYECMGCRFGCPVKLINNQGGNFIAQLVEILTIFYTMAHKKSISDYPQENRLVQSTNKTLQNTLKKIVSKNWMDGDTKLHNAL